MGGLSLFYDWFPVYNFHLGLFCFASGYLYTNYESIFSYIKRKFKRLIIPLYSWNIIYGVFLYITYYFGFSIRVDPSVSIIDKLFIMPIVHGQQFGYNLATWFIFPFFCVEIVNVFIRSFVKVKYKDEVIFVFSLIIG